MGYLVDIVTQTHIFTVVDDYYILGEFTILHSVVISCCSQYFMVKNADSITTVHPCGLMHNGL
jgi:hypothetical protein